jgi:hypothetical protein
MIQDNAVTSTKISDGTIVRNDVSTTFKAPYADTADFATTVNVLYVDSARIANNAYNAHKLQGKDTVDLSTKFVDEGQTNAITNPMLINNAVTSSKIADSTITRNDVTTTFKAPYADTADFANTTTNIPYVDSARIAANAYKLEGNNLSDLDTRYVNEAQPNSISSGMLQNSSVEMLKINQSGALTGQVIKWNGSTWQPRPDSAAGSPIGPAYGVLDGNYPGPTFREGSVSSTAILDSTIDEIDIKNNAVSSAKIIDSTITTADLAFTPVTRPIAPGVSSAEIQDGAILGDDISIPLNLQGSVNWPNGIVHIKNRGVGRGIVIDSAGFGGVHIAYAFTDGFNVGYAAQSGLSIDTVGGSAIRITTTPFDAVGVDEAGFTALYAMHAGGGVQIDSSESDGIYTYGNLSGGRLIASNAGGTGLVAHAYNNISTDTAIQAYGSGYATGGWYTGGLLDNKSAPCLISDELGIITSGTATLNNSEATISFDPLFTDNIRTDIPIRITVTPKGKPAGFLYVTESKASGFIVAMEVIPGLEKNDKDVTFDWIAVGTLKDYQTSPDAQAQWQQMIRERDAQREARKQQYVESEKK